MVTISLIILAVLAVEPFFYFLANPETTTLIYLSALNTIIIFLVLQLATRNVRLSSVTKSFDIKNLTQTMLIILTLSILTLLMFINKNINDLNFFEIFKFTQSYRNGQLKGSFFYTFMTIKVLPIVLFVYVQNNVKSKIIILIALIFLLFAGTVLGLRIFLILPIISFLILLGRKSHWFLLFGGLAAILLLSSIKLYVAQDAEKTFIEHLMKVFMRHEYEILFGGRMMPFFGLELVNGFPIYNLISDYSLKETLNEISPTFANRILSGNPNGFAIPIFALLFLSMGIFYIPFAWVILALTYLVFCSLYKARESGVFWVKVYIFYALMIAVCDDYNALNMLLDTPFTIGVIILLRQLRRLSL